MTLTVKEVQPKTILSASKVYPYVINPYTGCQHACSYCYARFMKRVTGHKEPWASSSMSKSRLQIYYEWK